MKKTEVSKSRISADVGFRFVVDNDNFEVSFDYNTKFAKRYQSHIGSLKLKVNF